MANVCYKKSSTVEISTVVKLTFLLSLRSRIGLL